MKQISDPRNQLAAELAAIRTEFAVPPSFPAEVLAAAERAATRSPTTHVDRRAMQFVTLDPVASTDLDQAFAIERSGADLILHYAIADIGWFVDDGGAIDAEAWRRGETIYLPDGKAGLYPPLLSEGTASLLPGGPRPATIFAVRVAPDGGVRLDAVERAVIVNAAKLAYETVRPSDLPDGFAELARRIQAAEDLRGASRVDPPEQAVEVRGDGSFELAFRPRLRSEDDNAALSLATNLAVADALRTHATGLFRVMAEPDAHAIMRLRRTAEAFHITWPADLPLDRFERTLDPADPRHAALMLAIRRAGPGASYAPFRTGVRPWHAAMATTYAHATAPLRRLADRYVIRAAYEIANGRAVSASVTEAFERLPAVMARADALGGRIDRAVVDLAEATLLRGREGERFSAVVTDADPHGAKIQLRGPPVVARIAADGLEPGATLEVRLVSADPERRTIVFVRE